MFSWKTTVGIVAVLLSLQYRHVDAVWFNSSIITATDMLPVLLCNTYCDGTKLKYIFPSGCTAGLPWCQSCRCDKDCDKYGECCPDNTGEVRTRQVDDFSCVRVSLNDSLFTSTASYYMKTSCPGITAQDKGEFMEFHELSPVTSLVTNTTYLNSLIAVCNNDTDYTVWVREYSCSYTDLNEIHCNPIFWLEEDLPLRYCSPYPDSLDYVQSCAGTWSLNGTGTDIKKRCETGSYFPVRNWQTRFKNVYCYECNGHSVPVFTCYQQQIVTYSLEIGPGINTLWCTSCVKPKVTCTSEQWENPTTNECHGLECRTGLKLQEKRCVREDQSLLLYQIAHFFTSGQESLNLDWRVTGRGIVEAFAIQSESINLLHFMIQVFEEQVCPSDDNHEDSIFGIRFMFTTNETDEEDIDQKALKLIDNILTSKTSGLIELLLFDMSRSKTIYNDMYINMKETPEDRSGSLYAMLFTHHDQIQSVISLPRILPRCPYVLYDHGFKWLTNGSLRLNNVNFDISPAEFTKRDNTSVVFCLENLRKIYKPYEDAENSLRLAENITSVCVCTLSLVCLAVTLLTYCVFPSLLTLPTKNTMCFVISLFLAQLILQFGGFAAEDKLACKIFGVFLHYLWLCVIFWMNVCSFHMFKVFVIDAGKPLCTENSNRQLLKYIAYANGVPLVILLAVITVNLAQTKGEDIGYGSERCYLATPLLVGVAFLLPLGLIVLVNVILFIVTIRTISKIHQSCGTANQDKGHVIVYIKLSSLTGIFWTIAILAELLHEQVLVFIGIILNGSQGVFIFLSYIANKKVFELWRDKICKRRVSADFSNSTMSTRM